MDSPLKASCATARRMVGYWSRSRFSRRSMLYSFLAWIGLASGSYTSTSRPKLLSSR